MWSKCFIESELAVLGTATERRPWGQEGIGMNLAERCAFKDPTDLTKWVRGLLCANIVIAVVALFSGTLELQLLTDLKEGVHASESQALAAAEASDARQQLVGVFQIVIFVVSGILILMWKYRANFNAHQLGGTRMEFTPGWSIGWYFIPFSNLWKPYQAMKEIWKASRNPEDWQIQGVSPCFLGGGYSGSHRKFSDTLRSE